MFSCLGLLSCAELCIFLCHLVFCLCVIQVIGWEDLLSWYLIACIPNT